MSSRFDDLINKAQNSNFLKGVSFKDIRDAENKQTSQMTEDQIVRLAADIAALTNPTGVADTINREPYQLCSKIN